MSEEPMAETAEDVFERDVAAALGEKLRQDQFDGSELWSALANIKWAHPNHGEVSYTFRTAGAFIAELVGSGGYMDWYCSGPAGVVSERIADALKVHGWTWAKW